MGARAGARAEAGAAAPAEGVSVTTTVAPAADGARAQADDHAGSVLRGIGALAGVSIGQKRALSAAVVAAVEPSATRQKSDAATAAAAAKQQLRDTEGAIAGPRAALGVAQEAVGTQPSLGSSCVRRSSGRRHGCATAPPRTSRAVS